MIVNKSSALPLFALPPLALAAIWTLFLLSTQVHHPPVTAEVRDTPERILNFVRGTNSPLVLINFWASWCEPCKEELPALKKLEEKLGAKGLKVILISIDDHEEIDEAKSFLRDNSIAFTSFYKGSQPLKFVSQIYPKWSGAVPATLLMNRDLKILDAWEGDTTLEEFEERVAPFLRGKS